MNRNPVRGFIQRVARARDGLFRLSSARTVRPRYFPIAFLCPPRWDWRVSLGAAGRLLSNRGVDLVARLRPQAPESAMSEAERRSAHATVNLTTGRVAPM